MLKRQGQLGPDGGAPRPARPARPAQAAPRKGPRIGPVGYARSVRAELKKVSYPTRIEVRNYSTVVVGTLLLMMALIFGLDYAFGEGAMFLFK